MKNPRQPLAINEDAIVHSVFLILLLFIVEVFVIRGPGVADPDIWWHLRTGKWVWEHGAVPLTDPFSIFGSGKRWIAYSWSFDLLVYYLYTSFGLVGLVYYNLALTLGIVVAVFALIRKFERVYIGAVLLAVLCSAGMLPVLLTPRPWLFSILFFVIELYILLTVRRDGKTWKLWLLPPLFAVWANVHIQFVYGFFILAVATPESLTRRALRSFLIEGEERAIGASKMVLVSAGCIAATLLNPYYHRIYLAVYDISSQKGFYELVSELRALQFRSYPDFIALGLTVAAAFVVGRRRRADALLLPIVLAGLFLSFRSMRDVWFVVIGSAAILATSRSDRETGPHSIGKLHVFCSVVIVCMLAAAVFWKTGVSQEKLQSKVSETFPEAAAAVIESRNYPGPLYNHFNWGGYLIWRLPRLPVSIDGRTNIYGVERTKESFDVWDGRHEWTTDSELASARLVIAPKDTALTSLLRLDSRFDLTYEDGVAAVFVARPNVFARSQ